MTRFENCPRCGAGIPGGRLRCPVCCEARPQPPVPPAIAPLGEFNRRADLTMLKILSPVIGVDEAWAVDRVAIRIDERKWRAMSDEEAVRAAYLLRNLLKERSLRVRILNEKDEVFLSHEQLRVLADFPHLRSAMPLPPDPALDLM
jgi:hypothetical protein